MLDVIKACALATKDRNEPYVVEIIDIGHSYVVSTLSTKGESADVSPCILNKKTGAIGVCFVPDYWNELIAGQIIPVPEEYQYT